MISAVPQLLLGAWLLAAATECPPTLQLEGPADVVRAASAALSKREVHVGSPGAGCAAPRAELERTGEAIHLRFFDDRGRLRERTVAKLATAVSLLESWIRTDLDTLEREREETSLAPSPPPLLTDVPDANAPEAPSSPPPKTTRRRLETAEVRFLDSEPELLNLPRQPPPTLSLGVEGISSFTPRAGIRTGIELNRGLFRFGGALRGRAYLTDGFAPSADGLQVHALGVFGVPFRLPGGALSLTPTVRLGLGIIEHESSVRPGVRSGALGAAVDGALVFQQRIGKRFGYFVEAAWEESLPLYLTPAARGWTSRGKVEEGAFALHLGVTGDVF